MRMNLGLGGSRIGIGRRSVAAVLFVAVLLAAGHAHAQTAVRAWSAKGQVFVVWQVDASPPLTYEIYRSSAPVGSTAQATFVGRVFQPEWRGDRLKLGSPNATWRVPTAGGGSYQLAANEGLFVFTPRAASNEFFAVVRQGTTAIAAANRTEASVAVGFDPVGDPVTCHLQRLGVTPNGYPYRTFAMWVDGRDDPNDARPDFPVMANAAKNGAPHVFTVYEPIAGLPPGPYPATVCLHGGGQSGSHWSWAPESIHYRNTEATPVQGVTVAMDDRLFIATSGVVSTDRPTNWFGWHPGLDPLANTVPSANAIVVPYTLRRLVWTIDWLQTRSTYAIDPLRTSVMGNSMGGAGTLLLSRFRPDRFNAATAFVPQHYTPETGQRLFGTTAQNLRTTEFGPGGVQLRVNDFFDAAVRLSADHRDHCLTRIFRGRRDEAVEWGPLTIGLFEDLNAGRFGTHLYWDNRDHTASDWTTDSPKTPGVDIGEWIVPVRTQRSGAPYQGRYRSDRSYPGFFDDDQSPSLPGRQPTLGNGSPDNGTPWGTWGGYFDWETESIVDTAEAWECTIFLVGQSAASVDNFPGTSATAGVTIRKANAFRPAAGTELAWTLRAVGGAVVDSGTTTAAADGLVAIAGLTIPKDPLRVRLEVRADAARPGDLNGDDAVNAVDLGILLSQWGTAGADLDGDGTTDARDLAIVLANWG
jgi:pimeloyl-ACP methyl ester carboxylesterase